jgi:hypothetical protein
MSAPRCAAHRPNGAPCQGFAISGSRFCFAHDPTQTEKRAAARRRGGEAGNPPPLPESNLALRTMSDVLALIETTVNDLRAGRVDVKVANAIGYLANVAVKVIQQSDLEARLAALESVLDPDRPSVAARRRVA